MVGLVSPHVVFTRSLAVILKWPENVREEKGSGHMIRIFLNIPAGPRRFKSPGQRVEPGPSQAHSRTSPKGELRLRMQYS